MDAGYPDLAFQGSPVAEQDLYVRLTARVAVPGGIPLGWLIGGVLGFQLQGAVCLAEAHAGPVTGDQPQARCPFQLRTPASRLLAVPLRERTGQQLMAAQDRVAGGG